MSGVQIPQRPFNHGNSLTVLWFFYALLILWNLYSLLFGRPGVLCVPIPPDFVSKEHNLYFCVQTRLIASLRIFTTTVRDFHFYYCREGKGIFWFLIFCVCKITFVILYPDAINRVSTIYTKIFVVVQIFLLHFYLLFPVFLKNTTFTTWHASCFNKK